MNEFWTNVSKYAHDLGIRIWEDDFSRGVICGLAAYFVVLFLVHLLFLICRGRKKCSQLVVRGEKGEIAVSIKAVTSVARAVLEQCAQLEIGRLCVYRHKKGYVFDVRGTFHAGSSGAPEIYEIASERIKAEMKAIFGIENIVRVDLRIDACEGATGMSASAEKPVPPPAEEPVVPAPAEKPADAADK